MKKNEFVKIMEMLKGTYGDKFPQLTDECLMIWYECFKKYTYQQMASVIVEYVKYNKYTPTIADLHEYASKFDFSADNGQAYTDDYWQ